MGHRLGYNVLQLARKCTFVAIVVEEELSMCILSAQYHTWF